MWSPAISLLGLRTAIVTKVPDNDMGRFIKNKIRFYGISDDYLIYDTTPDTRVGIYYYESGAYPRKPSVLYDRRHSSINHISFDEIDPRIFSSTRIFHTSGITLALGQNTRETAVKMIRAFKEQGALISFDVNYRANLWDEKEARETILSILPYVDILFVSEETSRQHDAENRHSSGNDEELLHGIRHEDRSVHPPGGQEPQMSFLQFHHLCGRGGQMLHRQNL